MLGRSRAATLERGAGAVRVIDLEDARERTRDAGEVLARTEGVTVRRSAGLGSTASIGIRGFTDARIRAFVDGVPLELGGFPFGLANAPLELFDRIEIHRGQVPLRLGADALGGAIELVSLPQRNGTHGRASYQAGSFDTHRLTLGLGHRDPQHGYFVRARSFADFTQNDYPMWVDAAARDGRVSPTRVYRQHDAYRALGLLTEVGALGLPWADRIELRTVFAHHDKELPHNLLASVPYGQARYARRALSAQLRHKHALSFALGTETVIGYASLRTGLQNLATCRYDWTGACLAELPQRGEIRAEAINQHVQQHTVFSRAHLQWEPSATHTLRFTLAPTFTTRGGENAALSKTSYDPLNGRRELLRGVVGAEHELHALYDRLLSLSFVKLYGQRARADEQLPNGRLRDLAVGTERAGLGHSTRFVVSGPLYAKATYEYAARLPEVDELFGDGVLTIENLHLAPEVSHNASVTVALERSATPIGSIAGSISGFASLARDLIVRLSTESYYQHDNVLRARVLGVEGAARWALASELLAIGVNATFQDVRNVSRGGAFEGFRGDRIPNRPYLFGTLDFESRIPGIFDGDGALIAGASTRYTHAFYRGWESVGDAASKLVVPEQLVHDLTLGYRTSRGAQQLSFFIEVHNVGNARVLDNYGMPRPGRAAYAKLSVAL